MPISKDPRLPSILSDCSELMMPIVMLNQQYQIFLLVTPL